ncbi:hypothetical protein ACSBR2_041468 [Camellia fascicularis]
MVKGSDDLLELTQTIRNIIEEGVKKTKSMPSPCIFRVPEKLRKVKESAYTPQLVSIGPLHSNKEHLKSPMEDIKKQYAEALFMRVQTANKTMDITPVLPQCVEKMKLSLYKARDCYAEEVEVDALDVPMLVIDGCFILELLYRWYHKAHDPDMIGTSNNPNSNNKTSQDFCFDTALNRVAIRQDLLLLENQLPFFVLEDLFSLTVANTPNHTVANTPNHTVVTIPNHPPSLSHYLLSYFGNMMNPSEQSDKNDWEQSHENDRDPKICHILHFLYNQYRTQEGTIKSSTEPINTEIPENKKEHQDSPKTNSKEHQDSPKTNSMPPASELEYAGVKFEVSTKTGDKDTPFKVQFVAPRGPFWCCRRASFKIPTLQISAATERLLRNLIAFEQCYTGFDRNTGHYGLDLYFTSYATLMDRLVDTENDVQVLEKAGVIYSRLGDREEASDLFHSLCKEIVLPRDSFYFAQACNQAAIHSKRRWPKYLVGYLRRTYFTNPWTFIAFVVAFIVFGIQVAQLLRNILR